MPPLPAVVTITDLPTGTTLTGAELIEAVQTSGGVANSIQVSLAQAFAALGGIPTATVTGTLLQSLGKGFSATWIAPSAFVTVGSGLSVSGSTTLSLALASASGLSVLGVTGSTNATSAPIVGAAAQVLRVNDAGTGLAFGALNLGSAAAVTGILPGGNYSSVNLAAGNVAGGVQGVLPAANVTAINVSTTGSGGIQGQPFFLPTTPLPASGASTMGIKMSSATTLGVFFGSGVPTFIAGTGSLYLNGAPTNATSRLFINTNGSTSWATFTASL